MFRLLFVPVIIGLLVFSIVFFLAPLLFSESRVVAGFSAFVLNLSNSVFASMPPFVAGYLARINLLTLALTVALLSILTIQIAVIFRDAVVLAAKGLSSLFKRKPRPAEPKDLPSIDIDAGYLKSRTGHKILGGGFDSVDPD